MIWLSSFTPSARTVSSSAPRSTVVLAPISTSSPRDTPPNCGILPQAPLPSEGSGAKPRSAMQNDPRADLHTFVQRDVGVQPAVRTDGRTSADDATRTQHRAAPDAHASFDDAVGADAHTLFDDGV